MRNEFERWATDFPVAMSTTTYEGSPFARFITEELPNSIVRAVPELEPRFKVVGSAGKGRWTHTSWVAVLDPAVTGSVQEGFYLVYLLSADGRRLYLSLNQGCTVLKNAVGIPAAKAKLGHRASTMRNRLGRNARRLRPIPLDLATTLWRGTLYETGQVVGVVYDTTSMPPESDLRADLREGIKLYKLLQVEGAWASEDDMLADAEDDGAGRTLTEAKRYRQHRSLERQSGLSKKVKRALGHRCMGCDREMADVYGEIAVGMIHAHHLVPLASLALDEPVNLDPRKDFAVLCPNCHSVIHRMPDPSDLKGLKDHLCAAR